MWEQGRCEEQADQSKAGDFPQEEEPAVPRGLSYEQLQLREAFLVSCQDACLVSLSFYLVVLMFFSNLVIRHIFCCVSDANLQFVESPALLPPDVTIDLVTQQQ